VLSNRHGQHFDQRAVRPSFWCVGSYTGNPFGEPSAGWVIFWQYYGSSPCANDGGFDDAYYMRLTNASAQVFVRHHLHAWREPELLVHDAVEQCRRAARLPTCRCFLTTLLVPYVSTGVAASTSGYIASWDEARGLRASFQRRPATRSFSALSSTPKPRAATGT